MITICPRHRVPLQRCCEASMPLSQSCGQRRDFRARLCCGACTRPLDRFADRVNESACAALADLECVLRSAIAGRHVALANHTSISGESLLQFVNDLVWALMSPLGRTRHRIIHTVQRSPFRMPPGFNMPVDAPHWLSFGSLRVRRCLLSVLAGLLQPENTTWPADFGELGVGQMVFWRSACLDSHDSGSFLTISD